MNKDFLLGLILGSLAAAFWLVLIPRWFPVM